MCGYGMDCGATIVVIVDEGSVDETSEVSAATGAPSVNLCRVDDDDDDVFMC